jgi:hypothetical protein
MRHEDVCFKSPDFLRPCHSCVNLEKRTTTVFSGRSDENGNEYEMTVNLMFCKKRDCFIHPHKVAVKGNAFETGDKENIEMPKECEFYENEYAYVLKDNLTPTHENHP